MRICANRMKCELLINFMHLSDSSGGIQCMGIDRIIKNPQQLIGPDLPIFPAKSMTYIRNWSRETNLNIFMKPDVTSMYYGPELHNVRSIRSVQPVSHISTIVLTIFCILGTLNSKSFKLQVFTIVYTGDTKSRDIATD